MSTSRLLNSVVELSNNRWGRNSEPQSMFFKSGAHLNCFCLYFFFVSVAVPTTLETTVPHHQQQKVFTNEPVFYGPDGKIISEEESTFLSSLTACPSGNFDDFDDEYASVVTLQSCQISNSVFFFFHRNELESDPEIDMEMKIAFKDFCKGYQSK